LFRLGLKGNKVSVVLVGRFFFFRLASSSYSKASFKVKVGGKRVKVIGVRRKCGRKVKVCRRSF
jgi:hypothetical protein